MPHSIDVSLKDLHGLQQRIEHQELEKSDWPVVGALVSNLVDREEGKLERMAAKAASQAAQNASPTGGQPPASGPAANPPLTSSPAPLPPPSGPASSDTQASDPKPGHGRNPAGAFTQAKNFSLSLTPGVVGSVCDRCKKGRLKRYREKTVIRIIGQPLFGAETYHAEQARCPICGQRKSAPLPAGVEQGIGKSVIYHWSACALFLVIHYTQGMPFKRLEGLHQGWGIPLPDANQWEIASQSVALLSPLLRAIERHGIEHAQSLRIDDTGAMVLAIQQQITAELNAARALGLSEKSIRTGINATCVRIETKDGTVILYFTGRHHAGEIIDQLLSRREAKDGRVIKVTDGASKNFAHEQADQVIEATCHAHAFLKFRDLKEQFPAEYGLVGEAYGHVYENDTRAKEQGMTDDERLAYHQQYSRPWLEKIHALCAAQVETRSIEPRSPLWEPVVFFLNQWPRLTKFLEVPGVPLDTNLVEQNLIIPVRYLAAAFNFQTKNGSEVGDAVMSLVQTAYAAGVEPVAYLTHCLEHAEDLKRNPEKYLPWACREALRVTARAGPTINRAA